METRIEKRKGLPVQKADAAADIALINRHSVRELKPEEVYCFSVILCDNDVDRDLERFSNRTLDALSKLFVGKTGISDHDWSAERQIARLYRAEVEEAGEKNALGEPLRRLRGSAYMLRGEDNQPLIDAIDGGIRKEVSIGCAISRQTCSICGKDMEMDRSAWRYQCEKGHVKGETYDGKLCCVNLDDPTDAYEFSFVAVPAQRGAGVSKSAAEIEGAFHLLLKADLSCYAEAAKRLLPELQKALLTEEEREKRAQIPRENQKYINKGA